MASAYYAVRLGRAPGIYRTWDECNAQVHGFPGASFKKFKSEREALKFIGTESNSKEVPRSGEPGKPWENTRSGGSWKPWENSTSGVSGNPWDNPRNGGSGKPWENTRSGGSKKPFEKSRNGVSEKSWENPGNRRSILLDENPRNGISSSNPLNVSTKRKNSEIDIFDEPELDLMNLDAVIAAFSSEAPQSPQKVLVPSSSWGGDRRKAFYAVHRGHNPGLYTTWTECERQIRDFRNASYRKFDNKDEAMEYVRTGGIKKVGRKAAKHIEINNDFAHIEEEDANLEDLKVDSDRVITVFTDGASSKNGRVGAAAGIGVYWGPNHPLNTSMRLPGRQTNNRAEIFAATHALRQAKQVGYKNIKLYTDSQFLIHGITDWIKKWKKNGWVLASGEPVKNKDDFIELDRAREGLNVEFIYIKAHDDNPGNVEADRLAVEGARKKTCDSFVCLT